MNYYYLSDGTKIAIDPKSPLGKGGEGTVYKLHGEPSILLKLYSKRALKRSANIEEKIVEMVHKKPSLLNYQGLTIIAWPAKAVYDRSKRFVGYLMHRVNAKNHLSHVITPGLQKRKFPKITWKDRLIIAINLSLVMDQIHKNDAVVGDINTSDFFVYKGFEIGVVDTDSFQFKGRNGQTFHCNVFTPDYTPPEVIEAQAKQKNVVRTPNHDNYGLAILLFQILMNGVHPFSARISKSLEFDGNAINYCMANEIFPYTTQNRHIRPPKNAMPLLFLPEKIQKMFDLSFLPHKNNISRPTSEEWVNVLRELKDHLKHCRKNKTHHYPDHFKKCPLCEKDKVKDYDYLLKKYGSKKNQYLELETTHKKSVHIKAKKELYKTLSGQVLNTKKKSTKAFLFHKHIIDSYDLEKRYDQLKKIKFNHHLKKYIVVPKDKLYKNKKFIGLLINKESTLFPISKVIQASKFGKKPVTEKTKIQLAKDISKMFHYFEKYGLLCELEHIYVNSKFEIKIVDYILLSFKGLSIPQISIKPNDYYPYEYYLYQKYKKKENKDDDFTEVEKKPIINLDDDHKNHNFKFEKNHKVIKENQSNNIEIKHFNIRDPQSIRFRLAIIIHLLIASSHPFKGVVNQENKEASYFIKNNTYLHKDHDSHQDLEVKSRVIQEFPKIIQKRFEQSLYLKNPNNIKRPSPKQWLKALTDYQHHLKACHTNHQHYYYRRFYQCPICYKQEKKATPEKMRDFCQSDYKTILDYIVASNLFVNKLILLGIILSLIYVINTNELHQVIQTIESINISQKLNQLSSLKPIENFLKILNNIFNYLKDFFNLITGGIL